MLPACDPVFRWFAVQVRSRAEHQVSAMLRSKGYEEFLPTTTVSKRSTRFKEPLFPGYVFCRMSPTVQGRIVTTAGVIRIVGFGGKLVPVDPEEMHSLQLITSSGVPASAHEGLHEGMRVRVEDGPLRGVIGILCPFLAYENRLHVSITMLMRAVVVEVDRKWIRPVESVFPRQSPDLLKESA